MSPLAVIFGVTFLVWFFILGLTTAVFAFWAFLNWIGGEGFIDWDVVKRFVISWAITITAFVFIDLILYACGVVKAL